MDFFYDTVEKTIAPHLSAVMEENDLDSETLLEKQMLLIPLVED